MEWAWQDREPEGLPAKAAYEGYEDGWNGKTSRLSGGTGTGGYEFWPEVSAYKTAYFWGNSDRIEGMRRDYGRYHAAMLKEGRTKSERVDKSSPTA